MQQHFQIFVHIENGCKNEWTITGKKESCRIFGLTWLNPESFVANIDLSIERDYFQIKVHG